MLFFDFFGGSLFVSARLVHHQSCRWFGCKHRTIIRQEWHLKSGSKETYNPKCKEHLCWSRKPSAMRISGYMDQEVIWSAKVGFAAANAQEFDRNNSLGDQLWEANQQNMVISCDLINQDGNDDDQTSNVLIHKDQQILAVKGAPRLGRTTFPVHLRPTTHRLTNQWWCFWGNLQPPMASTNRTCVVLNFWGDASFRGNHLDCSESVFLGCTEMRPRPPHCFPLQRVTCTF